MHRAVSCKLHGWCSRGLLTFILDLIFEFPIRFADSLALKGGAVEGVVADGPERVGLGEVEPRETGVGKGQGADRSDGGPHLEGAGELSVVVKGVVADVVRSALASERSSPVRPVLAKAKAPIEVTAGPTLRVPVSCLL